MSPVEDTGWGRQKKQVLYNTTQCSVPGDKARIFSPVSNGNGHDPVKLELRRGKLPERGDDRHAMTTLIRDQYYLTVCLNSCYMLWLIVSRPPPITRQALRARPVEPWLSGRIASDVLATTCCVSAVPCIN